jgi:WD40 repeat protein
VSVPDATAAATPRQIQERIGQLRGSHRYHVFISYARIPDADLARRLRRAVAGVGRRWWQSRGLRVFLDVTSLPAGQSLRHEIQSRLASSAGLVVLACPESSRSRWVAEEIDSWGREGTTAPVIVLTGGAITWDHDAGDFDWETTSALNRVSFAGRYPDMPLWIDLSGGQATPPKPAPPRSRAKITETAIAVAAAVLGVDRETLAGHERRRHRRQLALAVTATALVTTLAVTSALAIRTARHEQELALITERQRIAEQLVQQAQSPTTPVDRSLLLYAAAYQTAPDSQTNTLWQAAAGHQGLRRVLRTPAATGTVNGVVFSPDGRWLAAATSVARDGGTPRGVALVWPATGEGDGVALPVGSVTATAVAFSPDGTVLAVGAADGTVAQFAAPDGAAWAAAEPTRRLPAPADATEVERIAFPPDGELMAVSHHTGGTVLWRRDGSQAAALPGGRTTFGPDGSTVASVEATGVVIRRTGIWVVMVSTPLTQVSDLAYRDAGELAVLADGGLRLIAVAGGRIRAVPATAAATALAARDDVIAADTAVVTVRPDSQATIVRQRRPVSMARSIALRPATSTYAVGGHWLDPTLAGSVTLWDTHATVPGSQPADVATVVGGDGRVQRVTAATGRPAGPPLAAGTQAPTSLAASGDGQFVAAVNGRQVTVWTAAEGTARTVHLPPAGLPVDSAGLSFTPDGALLAVGRPDGLVEILSTRPGPLASLMVLDPGSPARDLAFSPDGGLLAVAVVDGAHLWRSATWTRERILDPPAGGAGVRALAWNGSGELVTTDGTLVERWELAGSRPARLAHPDPGRGVLVRLAAGARAGVLAAATDTGLIMLWDLATGRRLDAVLPAPAPLVALRIDDDGRMLLATGPFAARWSLDPRRVVEWICDVVQRNLDPAEWAAYGAGPAQTSCPGPPAR